MAAAALLAPGVPASPSPAQGEGGGGGERRGFGGGRELRSGFVRRALRRPPSILVHRANAALSSAEDEDGPTSGRLSVGRNTSESQGQRRVSFNSPSGSPEPVTPYSVIYGLHPNHFNFDRAGKMKLTPDGVQAELQEQSCM